MDGKLNSNDSDSLSSEIAGNSDPVPQSSSSSKSRSKSRSKVWEKVVWFTRKNRNGKEKARCSEDTSKSPKSSTLKLRKREDIACRSSDSSLCTTPKTKAKSGIKKVKSFNYLRRKKLKRSDSRHINPAVVNEDTKENTEPATCNQTATGTFHDFVSCRSRSSRALASSENLVSVMAKEMSCKQGEQTLEDIKSSLSSMSVSERSVWDATSQSNHSHCERRSGKFSGPTYNSWPRKKRLLLANQSYEALSPPQKQKRTCSLRKTATFSGFDSSKLSVNEMKTPRLRLCGVKSTPLLPGRRQIRNQNGLTIGVIHVFKSQSNQCSNFAAGYDTSDLNKIRKPAMLNEEKQRVLHVESSVDHTTDVVQEIRDIQNTVITCPDTQGSSTSSCEVLTSPNKSNLDKNEIIEDKQARFQKGNPSSDLHITERCNIGTTLSSNDFFTVESQSNQICDLECRSPGSLSEDNGVQATLSEHILQEISVTLPDQMPGTNFNWESKTRRNDITKRGDNLALDREVYSQLDIIDEVSGYSSDMNTDTKITELPEDYICKNTPRKTTATDIYCIKIEDQVIDFAKESSSDLHSEPQPMLIRPFVDTIEMSNQQTVDNDSEKTKSLMHLSCTVNGNDIETKELENDILSEACTCINLPSQKISTTRKYTENDIQNCGRLDESFPLGLALKTKNADPCNQTENGVQIGCLQGKKLLNVHAQKPKIGGPQFKQQTEAVLEWFLDFNDEQRNILIRRLTEHCELPQMHLLSVLMEPVLHKTCPSNCQDMLVWLPHTVTETVMSYLDPVSLCHCSQVNELWNSLASKPLIWRKLCRNSEWQLSRNADQIQCVKYTLPCGTIQWKKMFAERFLLRRNWLNGKCNVRTFEGHTQGISCVQFDDTRIVSGSTDKTIRVWDLSRVDSHAVLTLAGHSGTVRCLNLNRNRLVSGSVDRSIKVWDLSFKSYWSGASCKVTMVGHMHTVRCIQVDDHKVVSGSYDKTLKVWDLKTGLCKLTLRGHNAAVLCVQFDDSKIVSGSYDNTIKVWSLQEGECLMTLTGHHDAVTCLNLTQNGRKVISGSLDHNLKFWDLATGKCIGTLDWIRSEGHTGVIRCLQSDSWRIVSAGDDKTLKMWSLETGQRLLTLRCHTDGVTCLQFNDYTIVSGSYDKTVKVWNFSPEHDFLNPT